MTTLLLKKLHSDFILWVTDIGFWIVYLFVLFLFVYFACIATFITVFDLERPEKILSKIFEYHQGFRPEFLFENWRMSWMSNFGKL